MDLCAAEKLNGRLWNWAKRSAFMCFVVACALLGASLALPQGHLIQSYHAAAAVAPVR
jgi:hypothetical protein